jgi:quercetin 2,3-dioxygenase
MARTIEQIMPPPPIHWVGNGFRVHNFFPSHLDMYRMSPFFLLDYNEKHYFAPSNEPRGVGVHPHRGIETVTFAYRGKVAHHDSAGNAGVIGEGDVQWMTAGGGVLHKEYHEKEFNKQGGDFQMVQLWVNLPAKDKMTPAKYQGIENNKIGKYKLPNNMGIIDVCAGQYNGVKGPAFTFSPINLFNCKLNKGAKTEFSFPKNHNTAILMIEGSAKINNSATAPLNHFVVFKNDDTNFTVEALDDALILVMSGEPIEETIVAYGPFVMNTKEEIKQCYEDYNNGLFGYLED